VASFFVTGAELDKRDAAEEVTGSPLETANNLNQTHIESDPQVRMNLLSAPESNDNGRPLHFPFCGSQGGTVVPQIEGKPIRMVRFPFR
jgi:hypothetical protein